MVTSPAYCAHGRSVPCQLVIVLVSGGRMLKKNVVPLPTMIISLLLNNQAVKWRLPEDSTVVTNSCNRKRY